MRYSYRIERVKSFHLNNLKIVSGILVFFLIAIIFRLFNLQILKHGYYEKKAKKQSMLITPVPAKRGYIYDRNGQTLAINLKAFTYFAVPYKVKDTLKVAEVFSKFTSKSKEDILDQFKKRNNFLYLARKVMDNKAQLIDNYHLEGVYKKVDDIRFYPFGGLASQVIGFTNIDNKGIEGLEFKFDSLLSGEDGLCYLLRDGRLNKYRLPNNIIKEPVNGCDIYTTLDCKFQEILEDELSNIVDSLEAEIGIGIITNVQTNEILAMATVPLFNPNEYPRKVINENSRNRAITDIYEPGSTFKIFSLAAAMQLKLVNEDELIFANNGHYSINDEVIHDLHPFGWVGLKDIIAHSSNIGIIKIAERISDQNFFKFLKLFGFGEITGIELPGEVRGILRSPEKWSARSKATMSIGQEVAVTPIQLINAYNLIARDGALVEPRIIKKIVYPDKRVEEFDNLVIRRVLDEDIRKKLIEYLIAVVDSGTGVRAGIKSIPIAGKTGTAQYIDPLTKKYSGHKTIPSFIGFLPADEPKYSCLIIIKDPKKGSNFGGTVAAPVFKRIFQRIFLLKGNKLEDYLVKKGIAKNFVNVNSNIGSELNRKIIFKEKKGYVILPDFKNLVLSNAKLILQRNNFKVVSYGKGIVYKQIPEPGAEIKSGKTVVLYAKDIVEEKVDIDSKNELNNNIIIPEVTNED